MGPWHTHPHPHVLHGKFGIQIGKGFSISHPVSLAYLVGSVILNIIHEIQEVRSRSACASDPYIVLVWSAINFQPANPDERQQVRVGRTMYYLAQFLLHQKFVQAHSEGTLNDERPLFSLLPGT